LSEVIRKHYESLYELHGRDHNALQYSSGSSQFKRFEILLDMFDSATSIADVGCGLGDLLPVVRKRFNDIIYYGYDFVDSFLDDANRRFASDQNAIFTKLDITQDKITTPADYVVLSGMLNNAMPDNQYFTEVVLNKMWSSCKYGIAFNSLSTYVDYYDTGLYYQNPLALFDYCKNNFSKYVTLRHDYDIKDNSIPFEFTIYVYKK